MKRSHTSIVLSLFAVFGSGILVGAYAYHSYTIKSVVADAPPRKSPEQWRQEYVQMLRTRLQLEEQQVGSLNTILDDTRYRFKQLKERHKTEADQLKSAQTDKIRAMLKPTQLAEYQKLREERDRKMKAEMAAKQQAGKAGN